MDLDVVDECALLAKVRWEVAEDALVDRAGVNNRDFLLRDAQLPRWRDGGVFCPGREHADVEVVLARRGLPEPLNPAERSEELAHRVHAPGVGRDAHQLKSDLLQ
jgi:hypothetical protein